MMMPAPCRISEQPIPAFDYRWGVACCIFILAMCFIAVMAAAIGEHRAARLGMNDDDY
jgi:hypothetical protein